MSTPCRILLFALALMLMPVMASAQTSLVIVTNIYPPYVNEDVKNSFLPALFDEIGKEMGVKFVFRILPWQRCEQEISEFAAWGAIPYRKTDAREKQYAFSDPLYLQDSHFFAYDPAGRKPVFHYDKLTDLQGLHIGGIQGYYYEPWFAKADLDVEYTHSEEQNFRRLQLGRIDLFSTATTVGWHIIGQLFPPEEVAKFYTLEKPLIAGAGLHLMTAKDYPDTYLLLERFNAALREIKQNGTFAQLVDQYGLVMRY
ncbi:MAG: transporter substrate-binding domain-containing protein [Thalassospira sp.]|uniref:substrate-binding periplasmic protein n=1 Tax=Thalassospira sp. TaxID=1912094 RepID=UPI0032EF9B07